MSISVCKHAQSIRSWEPAAECKTVLPWASVTPRNRGWLLLERLGSRVRVQISPWPPPGLCGWGLAAAFLSIKRGTHSHSSWAGGLMSGASSTDPGGTASPGPGFSICDTGAGAHLTWRLLGIPQKLSLPKLGTINWHRYIRIPINFHVSQASSPFEAMNSADLSMCQNVSVCVVIIFRQNFNFCFFYICRFLKKEMAWYVQMKNKFWYPWGSHFHYSIKRLMLWALTFKKTKWEICTWENISITKRSKTPSSFLSDHWLFSSSQGFT